MWIRSSQRLMSDDDAAMKMAAVDQLSQETLGVIGAGYRIRTYDPLITNQVLYQLS